MKVGRHLDETPTDRFVQLTSIIINLLLLLLLL